VVEAVEEVVQEEEVEAAEVEGEAEAV